MGIAATYFSFGRLTRRTMAGSSMHAYGLTPREVRDRSNMRSTAAMMGGLLGRHFMSGLRTSAFRRLMAYGFQLMVSTSNLVMILFLLRATQSRSYPGCPWRTQCRRWM